ncbi:MAG: hypothetical protein QW266_04480 [Sulfolobales archaeon]
MLELVFLTITVTRTPTKEVEPRTDLSFTILIAVGFMLIVLGYTALRKKHKEGRTASKDLKTFAETMCLEADK